MENLNNWPSRLNTSKELGFFWGKVWIFMGFIVGGMLVLEGVLFRKIDPYIRFFALVVGLLTVCLAYGLKKRKEYGFYLVFAELSCQSWVGLLKIFSGKPSLTLLGFTDLFWCGLWAS